MINRKKIQINRKGIVENFLALIITIAVLALVFGGLYLFMQSKIKENQTIFASDVNTKEGLYTSRMLLNQEISPGYRVYDAVIKYANHGNENIAAEIKNAIKKFYPRSEITNRWLIVINDYCFVLTNEGITSSQVTVQQGSQFGQGAGMAADIKIDECEKNVVNNLAKVTVPNPDGQNILVVFKPSNSADSVNGRIFGYRADQIKGILNDDIPKYAVDGRDLEKIDNIPSINCDESATVVGKICAADSGLVTQLRKISANELQSSGMRIEITQAYRTYDIQKKLYNMNCQTGKCSVPTCNPDTSYMCPHMQAGAIDLNLFDKDGNNLNDVNPQAVEELMCKYGFLRLKSEDWHFEYNTNKWDAIQEKYAGATKPCNY